MSKIIAIDAGHGKHTSGKQTLDGTKEWVLNDRIADLVEKVLTENYDCIVVRTDDTTGKKDISRSARARTANKAGAKRLVSIHHNAGINGKNKVGGTVVYHANNSAERQAQAMALYNAVQNETQIPVNPKRAKIVNKRFTVISKANMPALLLENGFMDSLVDLPIILTEEHAVKTARGIVNWLVEDMRLEKKNKAESAPQYTTEPYYPAYEGKKTTLYNALVSLGVDASFKHRKQIAKANGINGYVGTAAQNTQMYNLLVAGILKMA